MPTMSDIAKRAGVTLSTVSYTLSGKRPISEEVKQRVYQAMKDLGYQPNSLARALVTKSTKIIALLYPSWGKGSSPQSEFIASIAEEATNQGYALLLWATPNDTAVTDLTYQGFIDGAILMEVALQDPRVEFLEKLNVPFILIGRTAETVGMSFVDLDFDYAIQTSVDYLAQEGHRHIALINQAAIHMERGTGYVVRSRDAFYRETQCRGVQAIDCCSEPDEQSGYAITMDLLTRYPSISAFILMTPWTSGGIVRAIHDKGLRIPDDISLVAIFSPRLAQMTTPALSSVDFPYEEMGRIGTRMLVEKLQDPEKDPTQLLLRPPLTIRSSSGARKNF